MQWAIETRALARHFGGRPAVAGIDLRVPAGSLFGFLGPNGAGKTTTIRLLLGLMRASAGTAVVLGRPMPAARLSIAREVGAIIETPAHYDHLTGIENLDITRRLLRLPAAEITRVLDIVELARDAGRRVGGFSLGMRQRLGIARALLGRPKLLILDEPTNGLDPDGIREIRALLRRLPAEGVTVFVSSHLLAEVEQVVSHVAIMSGGRLLAQGPLHETLAAAAPSLELAVDRREEAVALLAAAGLRIKPGAAGRLDVHGDADPAAVNFMLHAAGIEVAHLARRAASLEDRYLALTHAAAVEGALS